MYNTFKTILASFGISVFLIIGEYAIESAFLSTFLKENLVGLLLTLMAINTATSTVISSKLEEISSRTGADFTKVIQEVKRSLVEQIFLIALAVILLIVKDSKIFCTMFTYFDVVINVLLATILVYAIDILRDTGVAIFNIVLELNRKDEKEK